MASAPLLAHQGGWDEILLVVGPLALVAGLLWLANRRITAQLAATEAESDTTAAGTAEAGETVEGSSGTDPRS